MTVNTNLLPECNYCSKLVAFVNSFMQRSNRVITPEGLINVTALVQPSEMRKAAGGVSEMTASFLSY
jgi:hypothetical protein